MWTLILGLVVAAAFLWLAVSRGKQPVVREHIMQQMNDVSASSYDQTTNHFPMPRYDTGPIPGVETPFRVNMYQAYIE
jgi:hypothetical protein